MGKDGLALALYGAMYQRLYPTGNKVQVLLEWCLQDIRIWNNRKYASSLVRIAWHDTSVVYGTLWIQNILGIFKNFTCLNTDIMFVREMELCDEKYK